MKVDGPKRNCRTAATASCSVIDIDFYGQSLDPAMSSPSVLVVGAGELGLAVLEALAKHPQRQGGKLAVLLREDSIKSGDAEKTRRNSHIKSLGADLEAGDFISSPIPDLINVFRKYHVVIQCSGYGLPTEVQVRVTEAVIQAGVPRYIPWQFGMDYDAIGPGNSEGLFDGMLQVRGLLRSQSSTEWTIISVGLFMSYLFLASFGIVDLENKVVRALGSWETRVTVTTVGGIGTMTAEAVYRPGDDAGQVVLVGGETTSYQNLADLLDATYGVRFKREVWDVPFLKQKTGENPDDLMAKYRFVFASREGIAWDIERTLNHRRGIRLPGIREYMAEELNV